MYIGYPRFMHLRQTTEWYFHQGDYDVGMERDYRRMADVCGAGQNPKKF